MKDLLLRNWHLKLISLALATVLWAEVARTPTSEIALSVPLEYENIPSLMEVFGDTTERVEVRLRGPSSVLKTLSSQDVTVSVDMKNVAQGDERVLPLTPELVHAPFGVEVLRVRPARVRLTMEPKASRRIRIVPSGTGTPASGFEVDKAVSTPDTVEIEGPESHVLGIEAIPATVDVRGRRTTFSEAVDLDTDDPLVRIKPGAVNVEVRIRRQSK